MSVWDLTLFYLPRNHVNKKEPGLFYWIYIALFWTQCISAVVLVILIAKNKNDDGPTFVVKVRTVYCLEGTAILSKRAAFFDEFFFVEFLVELDVTSPGCVAFCCLSCITSSCACSVVICLSFVGLVCWLKIPQFSCTFVARLDATTRRTDNGSISSTNSTTVRPTGRRNFPFRKRSLPFLRHLENVWTIIESFSTKKKDIHNPDSNPGPLVC